MKLYSEMTREEMNELVRERNVHESQFKGRHATGVRELSYKKSHDVYDGAPNEWAAERGATHTLDCGVGPGRGTRPAKLLKTVLYVGIDENEDGGIVWEKWLVRQEWRNENRS